MVGFLAATNQSAASIFHVFLDSFEKYGINNLQVRLICQCYDGASVNSGRLNGLKIKFEEHFQKKIPYIHCFTHRLHLVVIEIVKNQPECVDFFMLVKDLRDFLKKTKVRQLHGGTTIKVFYFVYSIIFCGFHFILFIFKGTDRSTMIISFSSCRFHPQKLFPYFKMLGNRIRFAIS